MAKFSTKLLYLFSNYIDKHEKRVGKFFSGLNENVSELKIERPLLDLLQKNIAVVNLWTEKQYKGYRYLNKRTRRKLYENLELIKQDFRDFAMKEKVDLSTVYSEISALGIDTSKLRTVPERLEYLVKVMNYLNPQHGRFVYRETSSFGRLLKNPAREKMIGDCNQIVTLYIALYAEKFDINDLNLILLPGHVAIHFRGIEIEATSGQFRVLHGSDGRIVPVYEITSINLLDKSDENFAKSAVDPKFTLQSARLAYIVSSERAIVKQNLDASYHNTVRQLLERKDYKQALNYAKQSKNFELIEASAQGGVMNSLSQNDFPSARKFAFASKKQSELVRVIDQNEAAYLFNAKRYEDAKKIYERLRDQEMVKRCYVGLYSREQVKLGRLQTAEDIKANSSTILTMERYAKASGDFQLMEKARELTKYL